jgi:hypothetical protein
LLGNELRNDVVSADHSRLPAFGAASCVGCRYDRPLGELRIHPSLGSPMLLMEEIYTKSRSAGEGFSRAELSVISGVVFRRLDLSPDVTQKVKTLFAVG